MLRLRGIPPDAGWGRASTVAILVAVGIVLAALVLGGPSFREAFLSNFMSTVAGVAVGVPVAVWLALRETRQAQAAAARAELRVAAARRRDVLRALKKELTENLETLAERTANPERTLAIPFLQDEVWAAMSDGGELRWIEDPDLLRQLARSYLFVRTNIFLERQLFEVLHYPGMMIQQGDPPEKRIGRYLSGLDKVVRAAMDEGLAAIEPALVKAEQEAEDAA